MDYTQVQIQKVDNGFIVSTTKVIFGDPRPEQTINVFKTFDEVVAYISPAKPKLASAT